MSAKEISERWKAPMGVFWKTMINITLSMTAAGTTGLASLASIQALTGKDLPQLLFDICTWLLIGGFVGSLLSKLTCEDHTKLPTYTKENPE